MIHVQLMVLNHQLNVDNHLFIFGQNTIDFLELSADDYQQCIFDPVMILDHVHMISRTVLTVF